MARLAEAAHRYEDEELFCRVIALDEIRDNDHNLNITRYVQTEPPPELMWTRTETESVETTS